MNSRPGLLDVDDMRVVDMIRDVANTLLVGTDKKQKVETVEGARDIIKHIEAGSKNCVFHIADEAIKMDWVDVSLAAGDLLRARPHVLVSATVPDSMASSLGVPEDVFVDVGHPFEYAKQATLGISGVDGAYRFAQSDRNFEIRVNEVELELNVAGGGALVLFSSYADLERVHDHLAPRLRRKGITVLRQGGDDPTPNDELAAAFKADGNAVLFASDSFATGFDCPGSALRLCVIWKLPFGGQDPVTRAICQRFFVRYSDAMKTKIVQGIGRLIRTDTDRGRVWIADSRAEQVVRDPSHLTAHLGEFRRV